MKQIIPFVKDLNFGTRVYEITSIALEHNLGMENDDSIVGNFIVSGKYKINDISVNEEVFEQNVPFDITLDDKYDASKVSIDIDDFYYEIVNDEYLRIHIDVMVDNLVYVKEDVKSENLERSFKQDFESESCTVLNSELKKENIIKEDELNMDKQNVSNDDVKKENNKIVEDKRDDNNLNMVTEISSNFLSNEEKYVCYKVHIVRDSETIEQIKEKYNVSTEELEKYNNLDNIMLGTKLIIPTTNE